MKISSTSYFVVTTDKNNKIIEKTQVSRSDLTRVFIPNIDLERKTATLMKPESQIN